jgi:hypothetical protein
MQDPDFYHRRREELTARYPAGPEANPWPVPSGGIDQSQLD